MRYFVFLAVYIFIIEFLCSRLFARKFFSNSILNGMGVSKEAHLITGASSHSKQCSLIQAEMIFLSLGLGQLLMMGRDLNDMNQVLAVMILIIILGFIIDGIVFRTMERKLQERWGLVPA